MTSKNSHGFTLIELMIAVAIIGILAAIGVANYGATVRKSADALTKGNMGAIRSALSIYYGDNEGNFPMDNLASITNNGRYLLIIPITRLQPYHPDTSVVTAEANTTETGGWSYDNNVADETWGAVHVGCLHEDSRGETWSSY
jgi:prepilin-type N-terminal cleavage/methylation domain-containing protein